MTRHQSYQLSIITYNVAPYKFCWLAGWLLKKANTDEGGGLDAASGMKGNQKIREMGVKK